MPRDSSTHTAGNPLAFPANVAISPDGQSWHSGELHPDFAGMSLRDWFAATLASGHISTFNSSAEYGFDTCAVIARNAYRMADAMLKAREVQS